MDRHLLERLVGATVLVAAAIILIPEMLSGPHDAQKSAVASSNQTVAQEGDVKTYTIDLLAHKPIDNNDASAPVVLPTAKPVAINSDKEVGKVATTPTSPDETATATAVAESPATTATKPTSAEPHSETHAESASDQSASQKTTAQRPAEQKIAAAPAQKKITAEQPRAAPSVTTSVNTHGAWDVQVASLGARDTAEGMAAGLKAKGYSAFVMPFKLNGQTHFRVRIGPMKDRAAAEGELRKVKALFSQATLAPH